jgi:hypothetical protein
MRKYLMLTMALGALIAVSVAGVAMAGNNTPVTVKAGNLEVTYNGGFSPTTLSKKKLTPITFNASGSIKTLDGTHPPALKEAIIETDKNGTISTKGIPVCKAGQLQARDTNAAMKVCGKSLIGTGTTTVEVQFPEQKPVQVTSKLLVLNGGTSGGKTTLFIHAYFSAPVTGAIVTTVKIKKVHNGRYGLKSVATIPKIANGAGSVKTFNLTINKKGVLMAKCPDGKLQAKATGVFADGTKATGSIVRACKGK